MGRYLSRHKASWYGESQNQDTRDVSVINQDLAAPNAIHSDDTQQEKPPKKIPVKKSAHGVFSSLFVKLGKAKGVLWDRFVDAMAKVGSMSRHSGGSAVTFEPHGGSKWYGLGSIMFHRPHPDSTVDHVMLTSIGKRMNKWFGWDKNTFKLDK